MKKMTFIGCLCAILLSGCDDALDKLTMTELLQEANEHFDKGNYEDATRFFEKFEIRFPVHQAVPDCVYKRAMSFYLNGDYAQAVAAFESMLDRYPMHDEKIKAQKHIFYCFYNQVTSYERDYEMLEKAFEYAAIYKDLIYEDEEFEKAYSNLNKFMAFYYLVQIQDAVLRGPKHWVRMLWVATDMIRRMPRHHDTAEAYYRVIEFLCAQNPVGARADAHTMLRKMSEYHSNSEWYVLAKKCIDSAKDVVEYSASVDANVLGVNKEIAISETEESLDDGCCADDELISDSRTKMEPNIDQEDLHLKSFGL